MTTMMNQLIIEIEELKNRHAEIEDIVLNNTSMDQLSKQKLKKEKLWIKDRIKYLENLLYPDIIA